MPLSWATATAHCYYITATKQNTMSTITKLYGLEVLDSRGRPTVKAYFELSNGTMGAASVPFRRIYRESRSS